MSRLRATEPVAFTLPGDCECPGQPHGSGDVVYFRAHLSARGGTAATAAVRAASRRGQEHLDAMFEQGLGVVLLETEVIGWTLQDDKGKPLPVTPDTLQALDWASTLWYLADKATSLYGDEVAAPLVRAALESSPSGQTAPSTSPNRASRRARAKGSTPSSPRASADTKPLSA